MEQTLQTTTYGTGRVVTLRRDAAAGGVAIYTSRQADPAAWWELLGEWHGDQHLAEARAFHRFTAAWSRVGLPGAPEPATEALAIVADPATGGLRLCWMVRAAVVLEGYATATARGSAGLDLVMRALARAGAWKERVTT